MGNVAVSPFGTISPGSEIRLPELEHRDKSLVKVCLLMNGMYPTNIYNNCACNEYRSLVERHLKVVPQPDEDYIREVTKRTEHLYPAVTPLSYNAVVNRYSGAKKRRYVTALLNLQQYGLQPKDCKVRMFVKNERFEHKYLGVKPPRAIQYRTPEFNLGFLRYVTAMEEWIYPNLKLGCSGTRVVAKGLNWEDRAELIVEKASWFRRPLFIMNDYTSFDATIGTALLRANSRKYVRMCGRGVRLWTKEQLYNTGYTRHGIKYKVKGTRMSGDADTGLGNTLINIDAIVEFLRVNNITKYEFIVDGDDSVIIVEQTEKALDYTSFGRMGLILRSETTTDIHKVEFCQSRIIFRPKPLLVRNPRKVISTAAICRNIQADAKAWLCGVGHCELACNPGVPVLQSFAQALTTASVTPYFDRDMERRMEGSVGKPQPITDIARLSFYKAWGIDPSQQVWLETQTARSVKVTGNQKYFCSLTHNDQQLSWARAWGEHGVALGGSSWCWSDENGD